VATKVRIQELGSPFEITAGGRSSSGILAVRLFIDWAQLISPEAQWACQASQLSLTELPP